MQVLAGSLDVEVGQYLHAGYLSASPRSFQRSGAYSWMSTDVAVMDVTQSLTLKSTDTDAQQFSFAQPVTLKSPTSSLPLASMTADLFMLGVVVLFFAALGAVYVRRIRGAARLRFRWWETTLAAAIVLVVVVIATGSKPMEHRVGGGWQNRLPPPWLDVPAREYENPQAATQVILHGLITQGLAGCPFHVENLSAIQNQVAFPVKTDALTDGMRYALQTYGRDGWGREFAFAEQGDRGYVIASNGADGIPGNEDDVVCAIEDAERSWEDLITGIYVLQTDGAPVFLIHRVAHDLFRTVDGEGAWKLTGCRLFDALHRDPWNSDGTDGPTLESRLRIDQALGAQAEGSDPTASPTGFRLLLVHRRDADS